MNVWCHLLRIRESSPASQSSRFWLWVASLWLLGGGTAMAQVDRVYLLDGKPISGTVETVTKDGIVMRVGSNTQNIPEGDIEKINLQGDPSALTKGREFAVSGEYEQAVEELRKVKVSDLQREAAKAEVAYYLLLCQAKSALAGRGDKAAAATAAFGFLRTYPDSWHHYGVQKLTGDLALALNRHDQAIEIYGKLRSSPSVNTKIESVYLTAVALLAKGDIANAQKMFDQVIAVKVQSASSLRLQALAKAGKAVAMARNEQADQGLAMVDGLISELTPTDVEMGARIYNAQGASYEAKGDAEGAILAYLHTHLMFSGQSDAHAESLVRLAELWTKIGNPQRAAEAKQELQERYPGFGR